MRSAEQAGVSEPAERAGAFDRDPEEREVPVGVHELVPSLCDLGVRQSGEMVVGDRLPLALAFVVGELPDHARRQQRER